MKKRHNGSNPAFIVMDSSISSSPTSPRSPSSFVSSSTQPSPSAPLLSPNTRQQAIEFENVVGAGGAGGSGGSGGRGGSVGNGTLILHPSKLPPSPKSNPTSPSRSMRNYSRNLDAYPDPLGAFSADEQTELVDFAAYLGCNITTHPMLIPIIIEAMHAPLPEDWGKYTTEDGDIYFHNKQLKISVWEHPLDSFYSDLIKKTIRADKKTKKNSRSCIIM